MELDFSAFFKPKVVSPGFASVTTSSPGRFSLALEVGPTSKARENRLGTRLASVRHHNFTPAFSNPRFSETPDISNYRNSAFAKNDEATVNVIIDHKCNNSLKCNVNWPRM